MYSNEAQELRIILESLAYISPAMTLDEALPVIKQIEERTAKLKGAEITARPVVVRLPDTRPETGAKFIDLQPDIQAEIPTRLIHAIKEFRARTDWGLRESKEAVEYYRDNYGPM